MLWPYVHLADLEHRERIRAFNVRAARGEFIRYPHEKRPSAIHVLAEGLSRLGRAIRRLTAPRLLQVAPRIRKNVDGRAFEKP